MRLHRFMLIAVGAFVLVAGAPTAQAKGGTPIVTCAQTMTTSAVLAHDLNGNGSGVFIGASGITIDLNGFKLRGDGSLHSGIHVGGYDGITVKNGVIVNFDAGILANGDADNVTVSKVVVSGTDDGIVVYGDFAKIQSVTASGNGTNGVFIQGDMASVKSVNASGNHGQGLFVVGDSASVKSVTASGNYLGVVVEGDAASIQAVTAAGNGANGIQVNGEATALKGNTVNGNGSPGAVSDGVGLGIYAGSFTTPPIGTRNTALGNDNSSECYPAYLC